MTTKEWIEYASTNQHSLLDLIQNYHPANRQPGRRRDVDYITAPNAEAACTVIRKQIKDANPNRQPGVELIQAIEKSDWRTINMILNETWFGVPETTMCWGFKGYREAIHLIEELPDEAYANETE